MTRFLSLIGLMRGGEPWIRALPFRPALPLLRSRASKLSRA